jgi:hypothetical protein
VDFPVPVALFDRPALAEFARGALCPTIQPTLILNIT